MHPKQQHSPSGAAADTPTAPQWQHATRATPNLAITSSQQGPVHRNHNQLYSMYDTAARQCGLSRPHTLQMWHNTARQQRKASRPTIYMSIYRKHLLHNSRCPHHIPLQAPSRTQSWSLFSPLSSLLLRCTPAAHRATCRETNNPPELFPKQICCRLLCMHMHSEAPTGRCIGWQLLQLCSWGCDAAGVASCSCPHPSGKPKVSRHSVLPVYIANICMCILQYPLRVISHQPM